MINALFTLDLVSISAIIGSCGLMVGLYSLYQEVFSVNNKYGLKDF